ncbi:cytochrome c [Roseateles microcysteis]|uniref:cytochrome c n=1 Tax=Roseateles microcysteis TaxID=3119057 RepID=UPI002FE6B772
MKLAVRLLLCVVATTLMLAGLVAWLNVRGEAPLPPASVAASSSVPGSPPGAADAATLARGAYLAKAGNCAACHGTSYAGGRGIATPFGSVFSSNLTPDAATGIGNWSSAEFWRAMHHGRSKDGRLLYPAFPYTSYTLVTREDSDAIHAFLRSLPPVQQANRRHELRFPYQYQASLAVWRALYFRPASFEPDEKQSAEVNRGGYLVRGLGHCMACHSGRNALGGSNEDGSGGLIAVQNWYAPSLSSAREAGVAAWSTADVVSLLKTGRSPQGTVTGPMAEVVFRSTQHLAVEDLQAMAKYLQSLPPSTSRPVGNKLADPAVRTLGAKVYEQHCASCHGKQGEGAHALYPPLAGNRAVSLDSPVNLIQMVLQGGFAPSTAGNPRPFGMPPFRQTLSDSEVAAVVSHLRQSWGHKASAVSALEVLRVR